MHSRKKQSGCFAINLQLIYFLPRIRSLLVRLCKIATLMCDTRWREKINEWQWDSAKYHIFSILKCSRNMPRTKPKPALYFITHPISHRHLHSSEYMCFVVFLTFKVLSVDARVNKTPHIQNHTHQKPTKFIPTYLPSHIYSRSTN